ncbi:MAG: glycosyltransferase [Duncaniella sp.]|nr:glycosyltransferase [Duncaniella sp.]
MTPSDNTTTPSALPAAVAGKKILLVNHSDTLGGAAIVTFRLMQALLQAGLDVKMLVYTKTSRDKLINVVGSRFSRGLGFLMERLKIFWYNGFSYENLFKVSTGEFSYGITSHPWVKEADIICLNWINQGLMGVKDILRLHNAGKKIVWTMHDMWSMTGICHHSYECDNYEAECGNCPFLGGASRPSDISHRLWKRKHNVYSQVPVKFVAVSSWLEKRARKSSLLRDADVRTIPNAFPVDEFFTDPRRTIPNLEPYSDKNIILFGAARLDDPIKGIGMAIEALNYIFDNYPDVASDCVAMFYGNIRDPKILDGLRMNHYYTGRINDPKIIRHLNSIAKVSLSTSLYETLPGTIIEGQAGGAIPVTFGRGGQSDIVDHLSTGYIADYRDIKSVVKGILWALDSDITRESLHESVREKFSAEKVAEKYIEMFSEFYE